MSNKIEKIKDEVLEINGKILNIDDLLVSTLKNCGLKNKSNIKNIQKFGYAFAGSVLLKMGSTTVDDEIIAKIISAAIVAYVSGMTGGVGTVASSYLTSETVTPIVQGVLSKLNNPEKEFGESLLQKSNNL